MNVLRPILISLGISLLLTAALRAAEREVRFQSDGVVLVGTLTAPSGVAKSPALLMIPGSGAVDRNGNGDGLRTDLYRQLAQRLAELGYVTLRYDKRGIGASQLPEKQQDKTSLSHLARDAVAAYQFLRQQPQVDPQRVGVLGYED
ncbi:MAG: alpha/beta hydrolase, partial [bacterium]|nr:alpha/beta hydrolase [bacterium]